MPLDWSPLTVCLDGAPSYAFRTLTMLYSLQWFVAFFFVRPFVTHTVPLVAVGSLCRPSPCSCVISLRPPTLVIFSLEVSPMSLNVSWYWCVFFFTCHSSIILPPLKSNRRSYWRCSHIHLLIHSPVLLLLNYPLVLCMLLIFSCLHIPSFLLLPYFLPLLLATAI